ncbi:MAG: CpaF/VirB11 family protein [Clostridia bacterium]|nr:CpaF/VirB11 family protein [Clostridia bacterium]
MKEQFDLYQYLKENTKNEEETGYGQFFSLCREVQEEMMASYEKEGDLDKVRIQRGAIMGLKAEIDLYKDRIKAIVLAKHREGVKSPPWYLNLVEGIFAELFGFAGLTPWIYDEKEEYVSSTSAKVIGEKIYFLLKGRCVLQEQRIDSARLDQLKRALLMGYPMERLERGVHEVYLNNGIRVTIFSGNITKQGAEVIVFRKYVMKSLSFEKLAEFRTIPPDAIPLFRLMVKAGFNVLFCGPVRSGKTTFLQTWQSYEDRSLEGVSIATDTETDWAKIMGDAPFMQLVADGEDMEGVIKPLLRGDNDYVILEEMRDATAFNFAVDITSIGTRRTKATIHSTSPRDIPYKMATKIAYKYGGDVADIERQVFKNFAYIFQMKVDEKDPGHRVLNAVTELVMDEEGNTSFVDLMTYDWKEERWKFKPDSKRLKMEEKIIGEEVAAEIREKLKELAKWDTYA